MSRVEQGCGRKPLQQGDYGPVEDVPVAAPVIIAAPDVTAEDDVPRQEVIALLIPEAEGVARVSRCGDYAKGLFTHGDDHAITESQQLLFLNPACSEGLQGCLVNPDR